MGLARGFFQAGARTVVGSLWPLRDDEAEWLFRRYYRHLAGGESVASALAAARREALQDGLPAAAWAGMVVLGDGDRVLVARGGRAARWPLWTLGLGVVTLVAAYFWRARRRLRFPPP